MANVFIQKWLGIRDASATKRFMEIGASREQEYKCTKVWVVRMLTESDGPWVFQTVPTLAVERKSALAAVTQQAKSTRHRDVTIHVQPRRRCLGIGKRASSQYKATLSERWGGAKANEDSKVCKGHLSSKARPWIRLEKCLERIMNQSHYSPESWSTSLSACKIRLRQDCNTWRHNLLFKSQVSTLENTSPLLLVPVVAKEFVCKGTKFSTAWT